MIAFLIKILKIFLQFIIVVDNCVLDLKVLIIDLCQCEHRPLLVEVWLYFSSYKTFFFLFIRMYFDEPSTQSSKIMILRVLNEA